MPDPIEDSPPGLNRRTLLKASAWSLPVIAAAVGTPLAAASEVLPDIIVFPGPERTQIGATSPDGLQTFALDVPSQFDVLVERAGERVIIPPGARVVIRFDSRLFGGLTLNIQNSPEPAMFMGSDIQGNAQVMEFLLPFEFDKVILLPSFATVNDGFWVPDAVEYSVMVMPPDGFAEADMSNNMVTIAPAYSPVSP